MKFIGYFIALLISASILYACDDDDNFSTSSDMRLTFSNDTVRFDTVFTTIGTATKRLKVYNKNRDALTISSIELMKPEETGFRMNVDGESGNTINNVDILGEDSLYIFVEVTINPLNQNNPLLISDSIRFRFNGVTQYVTLEAIGQDAIIWKSESITQETTLTGEKPFLIYDYLRIEKDAVLNIEKNVRMYFHNNAVLDIQGRINAQGTIDEPVIFRGDRMDNLFESPRLPYDRIPGQWYGIRIAPDSYGNRFENVRIRNGVYGVYAEPSDTLQVKASFVNTIIQNTTKGVLHCINSKIDARNCLFANSGEYTINLVGGSYNFLHCTIANYMIYNGTSRKGTVSVVNKGYDLASNKEYTFAVGTCNFISSIISGLNRNSQDIYLNSSGGQVFNYYFLNSLLNISGSDDGRFVNTVWNENPSFKYIFSSNDTQNNPGGYFYYDFDLNENSPARNKASRQYAAELPEDIRGTSRRSDEAPDIGCYEWKN